MAFVPPRRPYRSGEPAPSSLTIRNVVVGGRRTSVRLEPLMWEALRDIACARQVGLNDLVTEIDRRRAGSNLTAAIRVYIVGYYRSAAAIERPAASPAALLPM